MEKYSGGRRKKRWKKIIKKFKHKKIYEIFFLITNIYKVENLNRNNLLTEKKKTVEKKSKKKKFIKNKI